MLTWARVASQPHVPTRGERNTQKIFGAVRLDTVQFIYFHQQNCFQCETYVAFLDQLLVPAFYRRGHRVFLSRTMLPITRNGKLTSGLLKTADTWKTFQLPAYWPTQSGATERILLNYISRRCHPQPLASNG